MGGGSGIVIFHSPLSRFRCSIAVLKEVTPLYSLKLFIWACRFHLQEAEVRQEKRKLGRKGARREKAFSLEFI